ncbi:hypothetical protein [Saccharibacillus alkalitolerans]|uniref:Uncharacterized protein n=1 Tax=Saccharibacillus alkalitolerans TaxID=2705290 RepID=A0ABX0FAX6_9BACL|nr:hypothetical protein [Saccharibacillus alkalitolerans]NGZ76634.1 hypothetical protein [Saccharibacillus alkalitolerans]
MQLKPKRPLKMGSIIISMLITFSAVLVFFQIMEDRDSQITVDQQTNQLLAILENAGSQLYDTARIVESGAGLADSIYAVDNVRTRLNEAQGMLWTLAPKHDLHSLLATAIDFDYYLHNELTSKWRKNPDLLEGEARERAVADMDALHADLDELLRQAKPDNRKRFDMKTLGSNWEETLKRRVQEHPGPRAHRYLNERYEQ